METTVLTPEIMKENNPGLTDFGSGNLITLTSQCLRCAKTPTPCTICSEFCPFDALETSAEGRPRINTSCVKCGACIGSCPLNALAASSKTLQQINRLALQASLRVKHIAITCERTGALLRLESKTSEPLAATAALELMEKATTSEHLLKVPCLGMLTRELWFSTLNEIGVTKLDELSVFLPPGQCAECPVNARDNVEDLFGEAIGVAEGWAAQSMGIITRAEDLPQEKRANVRAYLTSDIEQDRRGAFAGFFQELKQSWDDNTKVGNKALEEVALQRKRKQSFERTRLSADIRNGRPGDRKPIVVPTRYIFVEALGRNDARASEVLLTVSTTSDAACTLCGACVEACPVHARAIVDENNQVVDAKKDAAKAAGAGSAGDATDTTDARVAAGKKDAEGVRRVVADPLYCVACSACIQVCPAAACLFTEVAGASFLLDEEPDEDEAAEAAAPAEE